MNEHMLKPLDQMPYPKLVMFDLDGTLVDSIPDLAASVDYMLEAGGYNPAGEARVREWVGHGAPMLVRRAISWATETEIPDISRTLVELNLERFLVFYRDHCGVATTLFPGVKEGLQKLRDQGCKLAVVTNKPAQFVPSILEATGIMAYFDAWVSGDALDHRKPSPEPLKFILKKVGVSASEALMVGDSRTDIEAARAAGVAVAAVSYGYNHGQPVISENPDYLLDSLLDLAEALKAVA